MKSPNVSTSDHSQLYAVSCASSNLIRGCRPCTQQPQRLPADADRVLEREPMDDRAQFRHLDRCQQHPRRSVMHPGRLVHHGRLRRRHQAWRLAHPCRGLERARLGRGVTPNACPRLENNFLLAVSCPSASECTTAGYHYRNLTLTLVESWNGHRWTIVNSPNASTTGHNILYAVSCTSASDCTAVGTSYSPAETTPTNRNLIETWNGSRSGTHAEPEHLDDRAQHPQRDLVRHEPRLCHHGYLCQPQRRLQPDPDPQRKWLRLGHREQPERPDPSRGEDNWLSGVSWSRAATAPPSATTPTTKPSP